MKTRISLSFDDKTNKYEIKVFQDESIVYSESSENDVVCGGIILPTHKNNIKYIIDRFM